MGALLIDKVLGLRFYFLQRLLAQQGHTLCNNIQVISITRMGQILFKVRHGTFGLALHCPR